MRERRNADDGIWFPWHRPDWGMVRPTEEARDDDAGDYYLSRGTYTRNQSSPLIACARSAYYSPQKSIFDAGARIDKPSEKKNDVIAIPLKSANIIVVKRSEEGPRLLTASEN